MIFNFHFKCIEALCLLSNTFMLKMFFQFDLVSLFELNKRSARQLKFHSHHIRFNFYILEIPTTTLFATLIARLHYLWPFIVHV